MPHNHSTSRLVIGRRGREAFGPESVLYRGLAASAFSHDGVIKADIRSPQTMKIPDSVMDEVYYELRLSPKGGLT